MDGGNLRRYLIYAIGEIVLVVIGILIALQINNWNELQKNKALTKTYLKAMVEDLNDDITVLKRMEEVNCFRYHSINYLIRLCNGMPIRNGQFDVIVPEWQPNEIWNGSITNEYNAELVVMAIKWIGRPSRTDYSLATYEEMNNTGTFSSLTNEELKTALKTYYKDWDRRIGLETQRDTRSWIDDWARSLIAEGIYPYFLSEMERPLSHLREPAKLAMLTRISLSAGYAAMSSAILQEKAKELIFSIEAEVGKL